MQGEAFKHLAVVSIDSGAKLGYVDELAIDPANRTLAGLWIKADHQRQLIPISAVRRIGQDAVTVPNDAAVQSVPAAGELASMPGLDELHKLKVVDEAGSYLGKVHAIDIDPESFRMVSATAHEGGVLGIGGTTTLVPAEEIRSIGPELMVVASRAGEPGGGTGDESPAPPEAARPAAGERGGDA